MMARQMLRLACVAAAALLSTGVPLHADTRNIVMLFDERPELPGLAALDAEFSRTLAQKSADRVEIFRETMDRSRFGLGYQALFRDFLRTKYADRKVDAVVAVLSPALEFLLAYGADVFPDAPIIFCGIEKQELGERTLPPRVHGVFLRREFASTLRLALELHPQTRQVFVVAGTSAFDRELLERARTEFQPFETQAAFTYLAGRRLDDLVVTLAHLPPHSIVLFTTLFSDGTGETFVPHDVLPLLSRSANAPVYGFLDQYLGRGIVGGRLYSASAQGGAAAELLVEVLTKQPADQRRLSEPPQPQLLFDWRELQRWGIREASLPSGSAVLFRTTSPWMQYRTELLATIAALLMQAALILWLLHERQYRHRAERSARETMAELAQLNRMATAGELSATIAHEVNQPLSSIVARANAALRWLSFDQPDIARAQAALEKIVAAGHHASDVVTAVRAMFRKSAQEKSPIDINGLIRSVVGLVYFDLRKHGIELRMQLQEPLPPVAINATQLQQVVLNLMMNAIDAMKAAPTRTLVVRSDHPAYGKVHLAVEDSGTGIDPDNLTRIFDPLFTTKAQGMGIGLSICRSIISSNEGRLWASSTVGRGSVFELELPAVTGSGLVTASAA
jgi:signal transduction histidine kinase